MSWNFSIPRETHTEAAGTKQDRGDRIELFVFLFAFFFKFDFLVAISRCFLAHFLFVSKSLWISVMGVLFCRWEIGSHLLLIDPRLGRFCRLKLVIDRSVLTAESCCSARSFTRDWVASYNKPFSYFGYFDICRSWNLLQFYAPNSLIDVLFSTLCPWTNYWLFLLAMINGDTLIRLFNV